MKLLKLILLLSSLLFTQKNGIPLRDETKSNNIVKNVFLVSCEHPLVNKAKKEGPQSLTWKETPIFLVMSIKCKIQARKAGIEDPIAPLFQKKQQIKHEEAKTISGPGSFCITVTGLIIIYSFLGVALGGAK